MNTPLSDKYSAAEQGLGYIYQARLALLQLLQLPENTTVFLEKDDDLDFVDSGGRKSLASLKHKADGDRLTDLSTDFWKSVRIWLDRYKADGRSASNLRFFLLTTGTVSTKSFLKGFLLSQSYTPDNLTNLAEQADEASQQVKVDFHRQHCQRVQQLNLYRKTRFSGSYLYHRQKPTYRGHSGNDQR